MGMTFDGCIGDVEMDGKPIGLFNFRQLVQAQNCDGCVAVYVTLSVYFLTDTHTYMQQACLMSQG